MKTESQKLLISKFSESESENSVQVQQVLFSKHDMTQFFLFLRNTCLVCFQHNPKYEQLKINACILMPIISIM